jgi:hypothetical protein
MFIRHDHPLLSGCRIILWPDGRIHSNRASHDPTPTVTGTPLVSGLGQYPAVEFDGSTYYTLGAFNEYGSGTKDITIVFRACNTSTPAGGSGSAICGARDGLPADEGFVLFLGNTPASTENAWTFAVHGAADFILVSDTANAASYLNVEVLVVVRYDSITRTADLWVNGEKRNSVTDLTQDWLPWDSTAVLNIGSLNGGAVPFTGRIGPILFYDRAVTDGEILELMEDHLWAFLEDEDPNFNVDVYAEYATGLDIGTATGLSGSVTYTTTVDASSDFTGDLVNQPENGETLYVTTVNVRSVGVGDTPEFARYVTSVAVRQVYSPTSPVGYTTQVLVSPHKTIRLDGRTDLLDSFRYRR